MTDRFHVCFRVPIEPIGKGRPRARIVKPKNGKPFVQVYTPTEVGQWEERFADAAWAMLGSARVPDDVPLDVAIVAVFPRPGFMTRWSKRDPTKLLGGWLERAYLHIVKPDADNVAKIVLDALKGWFADERVAVLRVHKFIASVDEPPGVFVRIAEARDTTTAEVIGYYQRGN